jgi:ribosomal protein S18 acetylase RimI-like enzyme
MKNESAKLVRLEKYQAKSSAEVLIRAFQNYPALQYYYPDDSSRHKVNQYFYTISVYFGIQFGELYTTSPNLEGIAIWIRSADYNMNFWTLVRSVPLPVLFGFGLSGGFKMKAMGEYIDGVHKRVAPCDHWYLMVLGVDPKYQSQGYASRLVKPMLIRSDQDNLPCYLETNDEVDVPIYRHFGFKVVEEGIIPGTTVKNWAMLREVNAGSL